MNVAATAWYIRLRKHMTDKAKARADELAALTAAERPADELPKLLLNEASRLEEECGLI